MFQQYFQVTFRPKLVQRQRGEIQAPWQADTLTSFAPCSR